VKRDKNARIVVARPAPAAVLDFVDAARPRWDGQPEARPERPRDAVAAVSLVGSADGGAGAEADALQRKIRRLPARAVFPREGGRPSLVTDTDRIAPFSMAIYGLLMCGHENATCFWSRLHVAPGPARREFSVLGCSPIPASVTRTLLSWRATPVDKRKRI